MGIAVRHMPQNVSMQLKNWEEASRGAKCDARASACSALLLVLEILLCSENINSFAPPWLALPSSRSQAFICNTEKRHKERWVLPAASGFLRTTFWAAVWPHHRQGADLHPAGRGCVLSMHMPWGYGAWLCPACSRGCNWTHSPGVITSSANKALAGLCVCWVCTWCLQTEKVKPYKPFTFRPML